MPVNFIQLSSSVDIPKKKLKRVTTFQRKRISAEHFSLDTCNFLLMLPYKPEKNSRKEHLLWTKKIFTEDS